MNPFLATDGYKTGHHRMYPQGTTLVYSNFTPRSNKYAPKGYDEVVSFGQQMVMRQIHDMFENNFFKKDKQEVCQEIKREYSMYLGMDYDVSHIEVLWDLQYLPIKVKAIPEGRTVPIGVPVLTIYNTVEEFYWLTNFLETLISNLLWKPITSATIAHKYKENLEKWALATDENNLSFVDFQGHDFSMRGMDSVEATMASGLGHATSFLGSDGLPVIHGARKYYGEKGFVVGSVNATEHAVMCAGTKDDELGTFRYLMSQFPTGVLSIVSDTWDLWKVLTVILPQLKEEILARDGKIVIRPDSGNPVDILCGERETQSVDGKFRYRTDLPKHKGVIEILWDTFGGTTNEQGYKVLNSRIGAIYGDSITIERAEEICERLEEKGFASTNWVAGIGSFTYQFNTRDTFGFAMKATYVELEENFLATPESVEYGVRTVRREIFKDPITDDGTKKSAKGLLKVYSFVDHSGEFLSYKLLDGVSWKEEGEGALLPIYVDGDFFNLVTLTEIRERLYFGE
jgi:nicotinamide phosphoribosyltransferase